MPQRTLNWPRRIARTDRLLLTTGHGSFRLHRVHLGDEAFDRQRIHLGGYLMVLACEGSVILDGDHSSLLLREGDGALIPPGRFAMTEIPRPGCTRGETLLYFFNQRTLADLVAGREGVDAEVAKIALPDLAFYPVRQVTATLSANLAANPSGSLSDLRAVFSGLLNNGAAMASTFLKHQVFVPRFQLCLFLEQHLTGKVDLQRIASRYPRGARAFRQNCANYLGLPVDQWLFRRRIELAQAWLRYTDRNEREAAARLGYAVLRQFRRDMKRWGHFSPLELNYLRRFGHTSRGASDFVPFWFPSTEVQAAKFRNSTLDFLDISMTARRPSDLIKLLKRYPDDLLCLSASPAILDAGIDLPLNADEDFEEPTTSLSNIISFEAVEAWRMGESSFCREPEMQKLAA